MAVEMRLPLGYARAPRLCLCCPCPSKGSCGREDSSPARMGYQASSRSLVKLFCELLAVDHHLMVQHDVSMA